MSTTVIKRHAILQAYCYFLGNYPSKQDQGAMVDIYHSLGQIVNGTTTSDIQGDVVRTLFEHSFYRRLID